MRNLVRRQIDRSWRWVTPALSSFMLCGCLQTPVDTQAITDVPDRFAYATRANLSDATSPDQFWSAFRSPELAALIQRAEFGSLDIAAAIARIDQAAAVRDQAVQGLLPSGGGTASRTGARASAAAAGLPDGFILPSTQIFQLGLSATYEVDFWGKNAALLRSANNSLRATRFDLETVRITITARLATLYVLAVALNDQLGIAQRNIQLAQRVADSVKQRVEAGSATTTDQARQETLLLQQKAVVPRLSRTLAQTEVQIAILMGDPPGRLIIRGGSLDRLALPVVASGIPTDLLRRRPDIASAEARLLASSDNVTAARAAMLPSLTLSGVVGQQSLHTANLISPQALIYQTVSGLAVPIFDQVRLSAQLRGTQAVQDQLIALYRAAIIAGIGDVEAALSDLSTIRREEALLSAAANRARQAYAMSSEQLEAGQIDLTTVLLTQTTYFQALGDLKQIQLARFQAAIALFKALGGGWTERDLEAARLAATSIARCATPEACT